MGLQVFKIYDYDHVAETEQYEKVLKVLHERYDGTTDDAILIANYNIGGVELDALLITNYAIQILEFKNWGGTIIARENGPWLSGDRTIAGGASNKSPYGQMRTNRSRTKAELNRFLKRNDLNHILGVIIFSQDAAIYDNEISENVKKWLKICDNRSLSKTLFGDEKTPFFTKEEMHNMPELLNITEFAILRNPSDPTQELLPPPAYKEETALSMYSDLHEAYNADYIRTTYKEYYSILKLAVEQKTSFNTLQLNGLFAKINFLGTEYKVNPHIFKQINNTRDRLRKSKDFADDELNKHKAEDLEAICKFIGAVYNETIPQNIVKLFPDATEILEKQKHKAVAAYYRILVSDWNDTMIYGKCEELGTEDIQICYADNDDLYYNWKDLREYLFKDCQLNIVRPSFKDNIYYPELIIFEPDFLVDITTVAGCFEEYAHHPQVQLLNKIKPYETTGAIMLGNLAGQLLDEEIHSNQEENSYKESYETYIRANAFNALTTDIDNLIKDGEVQKKNIHLALVDGLQKEINTYKRDNVMLEPSFFSEMLGLQGRMDFLQLDYKVLLEQKSGKSEFVPGADPADPPKQKEPHYVQMLLYRAILHYNYAMDNRDIQSFLLYSKYSNGLIGLGPAPELLFEAMQIRNGLAWYENMYCKDGMQILDLIAPKPELLKRREVNEKFWNEWKLPEIKKVTAPILRASELEKAYFYRFMSFLENEHMLAKVGDRGKDNTGFAAKWHDTLAEKKDAGSIYDCLTLSIPDEYRNGAIKSVELSFPEDMKADTSNFRKGDIVVAYPYNGDSEPDIRKTMVFRGTILDIKIDKLIIELRSPQSDKRVFNYHKGKMWAVEHDFFESSFSSLYRGMFSLLTSTQERKDLLLFQREPEVDSTKQLIGDYGSFNDLSLKVKQAKDFFLIIGPPGTGKTSYGMLNTVKEELAELEKTHSRDGVMIMSYTNRAVDEICSKLVEEGIDFIRLGHYHSCDEVYHKYLLDSKLKGISDLDEMKNVITSAKVVVGTTTSINGHLAIFKIKKFSLAVIDEASQILEPHLIGILCAKHEDEAAIKKFVMIGDHKQLPAVVQQSPNTSRVLDPDLNEILLKDCRLSLFERLLKKHRRNTAITYMLTKQGRMHHDIAIFPNYCFYQGKLQEVPLRHQNIELNPQPVFGDNGIDNLLATRRIAFVAATAPKDNLSDKVNLTEAKMIAATVVRIYLREKENFDVNKTVGVIVPYRNQIATIRNLIDEYGIPVLHDITIDTVERYQGSQREYILYGFTISKLYQLNFMTSNVFEEDGYIIDRKLNVAMTRARQHLVLFGDPMLLSEDITFYKLIEFARSKHGYFEIDPDNYVSGDFEVPEYEKKDLDLSDATFTVSTAFNDAFNKFVMKPVKEGSPNWPDEVFGNDMNTNLNIIQYGRINFTDQQSLFEDQQISAERQVLLYCYYIMRQHYCSAINLYSSYKEWIESRIKAVNGRVQVIDFGCGPGTCGLAFGETFSEYGDKMLYTGVDVSAEMKNMANRMMSDVLKDGMRFKFVELFKQLDHTYWNAISETPSLVIFNFSYFFSNVSPKFTEDLAKRIVKIMEDHPLNKYVVICQQSDTDANINSFKVFSSIVFRSILGKHFTTYKSDKSDFSYTLNNKERTLQFCYDVLEKS